MDHACRKNCNASRVSASGTRPPAAAALPFDTSSRSLPDRPRSTMEKPSQ
jgi:hypothetical protein